MNSSQVSNRFAKFRREVAQSLVVLVLGSPGGLQWKAGAASIRFLDEWAQPRIREVVARIASDENIVGLFRTGRLCEAITFDGNAIDQCHRRRELCEER